MISINIIDREQDRPKIVGLRKSSLGETGLSRLARGLAVDHTMTRRHGQQVTSSSCRLRHPRAFEER